jgi:hypothetical protein
MALLIANLADFLSTTPEFIENWVSIPVKKGPSIDLPDFVVSFFKILPIEHFDKSLKLNRDWYKECRRELEERRNLSIKKYWDSVEECKEADKAYAKCWKNRSPATERTQCYVKAFELDNKKAEDFKAWVDIDRACLRCGFPDLINHINVYHYINIYRWGMDPYEIPSPGNDPEGILDYWGDEDPDA